MSELVRREIRDGRKLLHAAEPAAHLPFGHHPLRTLRVKVGKSGKLFERRRVDIHGPRGRGHWCRRLRRW